MSPKSTLSRFVLALALAVSAVGLGGCAETTTSGAEPPSMARVPIAGATRLASFTVPRVAPVSQENSHGSLYGYGSSGHSGGVVPSVSSNVR